MIFKGTQKELNRVAKTGSYLFNTNRIGELIADSNDSVFKYTKNFLNPRNSADEYKLDETKAVIDALTFTGSDASVILPVLKKKIDGKTTDFAKAVTVILGSIGFGWADPNDSTKSWVEVYANGFKKVEYQVSLSIDQLSGLANILTYKFTDALNDAFSGGDVTGTINYTTGAIALTVPALTVVTSLVATFTLNEGASAKIVSTAQVSGTTPNDFSTPKTYTVTSKTGNTKDFVVTVVVTP
ncbi:MAG: hypothetical protein ACYC5G_01280 [Candidatus Doudnabacteria bacterium]